jgi:hypothetical protein
MAGNLADIYHTDYVVEAWQTWMIYFLLVLIATAIVCYLPMALPRGEMVMFISSFLGFVVSFVTVLAMRSGNEQSAKAVFVDYQNTSGWRDGTSFIIGLGTCMYAYLAIDGVCHIAEVITSNISISVSLVCLPNLLYELSRHPEWQTKLREELLGLNPPLKHVPGKLVEVGDITNPQDIDKLPILQAVLMETLRLWPSVPGGQPRVVPRPCTLGGYHNIPVGTTVQSYASVLHRLPDVFPEPLEWKPERWLDSSPEQLSLIKKYFWGFGSGGRMCLGIHFAHYCEFTDIKGD